MVVGSTIGIVVGARMPVRAREVTMGGLGLVTLVIGAQLALRTADVLVVLGALVLGGIVGSLIGVEDALDRIGASLERRLKQRVRGRVAEAFLTSSLVFCVGPMTIVGSLQDGLTGDYSLLAIKSGLDLISSAVFASTLGPGVMLSVVTVAVFQGGLTLAAASAQQILTEDVVREMTATGGVLILGIGFRLLEIKRLPIGDLLPAILVAPLLATLF